MTRTGKRQGSAQSEAMAALKELLLPPPKNDADSTPRERAAAAFDLYQRAVSGLDALKLSTREDVTLSREFYKTLLANARKSVADLRFSQHTIALYVNYTKTIEDIRLVCDEFLEEKVQRFEADRQRDLERRKFITSLVDEFKRVAQRFCASSEEQRILLSEIYSAISDGVISEIPKEPPAGQLYAARVDKRENAPEFIQRVYAEWLTGNFTRADLRKIDPKADIALRNWERVNGRSSLNLPTVIERNDRMLASQGEDAVAVRRSVDRLRSAAQRRAKNKKRTNELSFPIRSVSLVCH